MSPGVAQLWLAHCSVDYLVVSLGFLDPAYLSILIKFVSSRFFRLKLAMGLYVIIPSQCGSGSYLTHASPVFLNLPVCLAGALVLALSLNGIELEGPKGASWKDFLRRFDFVGL